MFTSLCFPSLRVYAASFLFTQKYNHSGGTLSLKPTGREVGELGELWCLWPGVPDPREPGTSSVPSNHALSKLCWRRNHPQTTSFCVKKKLLLGAAARPLAPELPSPRWSAPRCSPIACSRNTTDPWWFWQGLEQDLRSNPPCHPRAVCLAPRN